MNFTEGPWTIDALGYLRGPKGENILEIKDNAFLCAASPLLLTACEWAFEYIGHHHMCRGVNDCDCGAGEVIHKLKEALLLAKFPDNVETVSIMPPKEIA